MRFVSSREIRVNPGPVFESLEEDEVVVTVRGKPVALLLGVSGENLEETVREVRRARAQAAVSRMRRSSSESGADGIGEGEIEEEILTSRRERRKE